MLKKITFRMFRISLLVALSSMPLSFMFLGATQSVEAADPPQCSGWAADSSGSTVLINCNDYTLADGKNFDPGKCYSTGATEGKPGVVPSYSIVSCSNPPFKSATVSGGSESIQADCNDVNVTKENCGIIEKLLSITNILSGLVGIVIVIMITYGGIQYSTASDNPQNAAAAKQRIANAIYALIAFIFTYAFLQYIIPGGIF